jgi:hypothetical protein
VVPSGSSGFVLIANSTSTISLTCGECSFSVENRSWFSNFTYSFYVDDAYGSMYLIVVNPPEQHYRFEAQDATSVQVVNFSPAGDNVTLSSAGNRTAAEVEFNVANSCVDPSTVTPEFSSALVLAFLIVSTLAAAILARKRAPRRPAARSFSE